MKIIYALLVLVPATVTAFGQPVVSSQTGGFTLEITANHEKGHSLQWDFENTAEKSLKAGSAVVIAVRKTNVSNHEIIKKALTGWIWDVRDSSGNPVGPNKSRNPGGWITGNGLGVQRGTKDMFLQPKQSALVWRNFSRDFDLSQPGTYTFQVSQHVSDDPNSPVVESNIITISVLPAEATTPGNDSTSPSPNAFETPPAPSPAVQPPASTSYPQAHADEYVTSIPASEKPKPTFTLSIEEDEVATQMDPSLHRLLVTLTATPQGVFLNRFHPEALNMYNMVVLRDGVQVPETDAMRALEQYRDVDRNPTIPHPFVLKPDETLTNSLDVSDYYDMSKPGIYQITVTRQSLPLNPAYSQLVSSNTVTIIVSQRTAAPSALAIQKPQPRFDLNIATAEPYETPPPTMIRVEMENTSNSIIRLAKCWPFMGMYNLFATRDGQPLTQNDAMRKLQKSRAAVTCPGNDTLIEINPGDSYAENIPLGNFYDVSQPGVYAVYVTRETHPWNPAKSVLVQSNTLSFQTPVATQDETSSTQ